MSIPKTMRPKVEPLIKRRSSTIKALPVRDFDPQHHIEFKPPSKIYKMTDLALPEDTGVSPVAVSEPFPLFSQEAIHRMRAEILSDDVWNNCQYSSNLSQCQLRGFASK